MKELKLYAIKDGDPDMATDGRAVPALAFSRDADGILRASQPLAVTYRVAGSGSDTTLNSTVEYRLERVSSESRNGLIRVMVKVTCSYPTLLRAETGELVLGDCREFSFHTVYTLGRDLVASFRTGGEHKKYAESLLAATGWLLNACSSSYGAGALYGDARPSETISNWVHAAALPVIGAATSTTYFNADESSSETGPLLVNLKDEFVPVSTGTGGVLSEYSNQTTLGTPQGVRPSDPITTALTRMPYPDSETIRIQTAPRFVAGTLDADGLQPMVRLEFPEIDE